MTFVVRTVTRQQYLQMDEEEKLSIDELKQIAKTLRKHIIEMTTAANSGHPSSSLSAVEVVTALYFGGFMKYDAKKPHMPERDRFVLSKGHAVPVLYAAMAEAGFFAESQLKTLRKLGSPLEGHPNLKRLPGIEASTGSLGQGLSIGLGQALAARIDKTGSKVYVVIGDGEMGEGQVWEAFAAASKYKTANLTAIIDQNGYQQTGSTNEVLDMGDFHKKIEAFGWHVQTINGNSMEEVVDALKTSESITDRPKAIVSKTQKGFGILPLLEEAGDMNFHGKPLPPAMAEKALAMLS
ncbi:Transketolase 2 [Polystyrenella longa]|uniref:Transketolase 2 n=1 Tax=Polystyrenella longa TaxID=2528007 RepID=A0A518CP93_9PLAN|nr:transketolase [Polystyrenella longa]QDU81024.1 Transketolase 2 [Polystyrenella longa]